MNVAEYYTYLAASREQLWNFVRALPAADLNRDLIPQGERFHNIKDLLLHCIDFEDHWVHGIARGASIQRSGPYQHDWVNPHAEQFDLTWITEYGREVTRRTTEFLGSQPDLGRPIKLVQDDPGSVTVTLDQLLWNVMTHEVRHTAQVSLLIRQLGHTPPWMDYFRFVRPLDTAETGGDTGLEVGLEDGLDDE